MHYICSKCGRHEDTNSRKPACECGGLWELDWQPPKYDESLIDKSEWSLFCYRRFMALESDAWRDISLGERMTPVIL